MSSAGPAAPTGAALLFERLPHPAFIVDAASLAILDVNAAAVLMLGRDRTALLELSLTDLIALDDVPQWLARTCGAPAAWSGRWRQAAAGGHLVEVDLAAEGIDYDGRAAALVVAVDVTERVREELRLRSREAQYRSVVDNVKQVIFRTDARGAWTFLNRAWTDVTGFTVEETLGTPFLRYVHPDDRRAHAEAFQPLLEAHGDYFGHVARYVTKAGGVRWVEVFAQLVVEPGRGVRGIFGTLTDITERKRADEDLAAVRARLEHLLAASPAVISSSEPRADYPITFVGENVARQLGWTVDEILDDREFWSSHVHDEDRARVRAALAALAAGAAGDDRLSVDYRFQARDGSWRWLQDDRRLVRDRDGRPVEIVASWVDVTSQRRSEAERARLSFVVEESAEALAIATVDGLTEYVNAAYERLTGFTRAEVVGHPAPLFANAGSDERLREMRSVLARTGSWSGRLPGRRRDGSRYEAEVVVTAVRDQDRGGLTYVAAFHDVTRQRQIEDELRQAQKMEVAGRLAGGIAHDFNNLLTVITGRTHLLLRKLRADDPARADLALIEDTALRATTLTRQLLVFSRKQTLAPRLIDLGAVVAGMEKMLRRLIGEDIELHTVRDPALGRAKADAGQIEQVVMNLVVNARDAMPRGGRIAIEAVNVSLGESDVRRPVGLPPGPYVALRVVDTGCGIAPETAAHIFEPFFTTKGPDHGTGLGLSTVYGIVKQSDGEVVVESSPGHGSTFCVYLPRAGSGADAADGFAPTAAPRRGSETVLLAEDEEEVRALAREVLEANGYTVLEARHGNDALAVSRAYEGPIHLLMTDVVMPQMGGPELAERLRRERPGTRVLFVSGYTDDAFARRRPSADVALLDKPFSPDGLARRVREVLEGVGGSA